MPANWRRVLTSLSLGVRGRSRARGGLATWLGRQGSTKSGKVRCYPSEVGEGLRLLLEGPCARSPDRLAVAGPAAMLTGVEQSRVPR